MQRTRKSGWLFTTKGLGFRIMHKYRSNTFTFFSEAWFLYSLIEQKGRFLVEGPVSREENLYISLEVYHPILREKFSQK